ncbi:MAG TPA: imidazolonepropionase [Thermotogota bacterium]|nr:imidazolonepropionase [Thermotogota bacterium]HRW92934.1 imidazolonepropionase [Thermotogota bacterium]
MNVFLKNISVLLTPLGKAAQKGEAMKHLHEEKNVDILVQDGYFERIGNSLEAALPEETLQGTKIIDCSGLFATPGLIDPHTHIPFFGTRQEEYYMRLKGADYLQILQAGGGILNTTRAVRQASLEQLVECNEPFCNELFEKGVTVFEGKSGYGLETSTEIKQLAALEQLEKWAPQKIVKTFLGPHAIPAGFDEGSYMDVVIEQMLPHVQAQFPELPMVDVFCEEGVFSVAQSRRFLEKAAEMGFPLRLHADEIAYLGGSELAAELGALSADHLIAIEPAGIMALAKSNTVATLLPGTSFFLQKPFAPARQLIDTGAAVALASDFNPGSCTLLDPGWIAHLAAAKLHMEWQEILTAQTLNAAAALGIAHAWGSVEVGKESSLVLWDIDDWSLVPYFPGHKLARWVLSPKRLQKITI